MLKKIKLKYLISIYGGAIIEAKTLDMLLNSYSDGFPRPKKVFYDSDTINYFELDRKAKKLLEDEFLIECGDDFIISSKGKLHLDKGGYVLEIKQSRRNTISYWMSIFAFIFSLLSLIL
ncbi:hypothetical protein V3Q90_14850 [Flavobacterium oreochromis]|uniref:hypothetical protein n=1 Tax=Flavobacterium oreochromis TaxID=2906078 RepID=UPI00385BD841